MRVEKSIRLETQGAENSFVFLSLLVWGISGQVPISLHRFHAVLKLKKLQTFEAQTKLLSFIQYKYICLISKVCRSSSSQKMRRKKTPTGFYRRDEVQNIQPHAEGRERVPEHKPDLVSFIQLALYAHRQDRKVPSSKVLPSFS